MRTLEHERQILLDPEFIKASCSQYSGYIEQTFTSDKMNLVTEILRPRLHYTLCQNVLKGSTVCFADKN